MFRILSFKPWIWVSLHLYIPYFFSNILLYNSWAYSLTCTPKHLVIWWWMCFFFYFSFLWFADTIEISILTFYPTDFLLSLTTFLFVCVCICVMAPFCTQEIMSLANGYILISFWCQCIFLCVASITTVGPLGQCKYKEQKENLCLVLTGRAFSFSLWSTMQT